MTLCTWNNREPASPIEDKQCDSGRSEQATCHTKTYRHIACSLNRARKIVVDRLTLLIVRCLRVGLQLAMRGAPLLVAAPIPKVVAECNHTKR